MNFRCQPGRGKGRRGQVLPGARDAGGRYCPRRLDGMSQGAIAPNLLKNLAVPRAMVVVSTPDGAPGTVSQPSGLFLQRGKPGEGRRAGG